MPWGDTNRIGGKFEVSYVDLPINRNIYYNQQGIFNNLSVDKVIHDKNTILVRGRTFVGVGVINSSTYTYYSIDRGQYIEDPSQMESKGLHKLLSENEFDSLIKTLDKPRILFWN